MHKTLLTWIIHTSSTNNIVLLVSTFTRHNSFKFAVYFRSQCGKFHNNDICKRLVCQRFNLWVQRCGIPVRICTEEHNVFIIYATSFAKAVVNSSRCRWCGEKLIRMNVLFSTIYTALSMTRLIKLSIVKLSTTVSLKSVCFISCATTNAAA